MRRLWIADLRVSDRTRAKLAEKHALDADDLRRRLVCATGLTYAWSFHPERGWRVIVEVPVGQARVLAVLYPADREEETWHLASAYRLPTHRRLRRRRLRP